MVIIPDTKHMDEIYLSEAAINAACRPIRVESGFMEVPFDKDGNLSLFAEGRNSEGCNSKGCNSEAVIPPDKMDFTQHDLNQ